MPSFSPEAILIYCLVIALLIAAMVGLILIQIKARPIWRLLSLAIVLVASLGSCSFYSSFTQDRLENQLADSYGRRIPEFIQYIDQLAIEGRTNDVHQSCQKFLDVFVLSTDKVFVTNFDQLVDDTAMLTEQTNAALKPAATAFSVSTNK
jgi:hypothetical protein